MSKQRWTIGATVLVSIGLSLPALGGWRDKVQIPGKSTKAEQTFDKSPIEYVEMATDTFLAGGEMLVQAAGDAEKVRKIRAVRAKLAGKGAIKGETLGSVDEASAAIDEIAQDQEALSKLEKETVLKVAVKVGVAVYFEKLAIEASKAQGSSPAKFDRNALAEAGIFLKVVPRNLKSMLSVQKGLFGYLKAKGLNPGPDVEKAVEEMKKG